MLDDDTIPAVDPAEPVVQAEGDDAPAEQPNAEGDTPAQPEPTPEPKQTRADKRIAALHAQLYAERRRAEALEAMMSARNPDDGAEPAPAQQPNVEHIVRQRVADEAYNASFNGIVAAGAEKFPDFMEAIEPLRAMNLATVNRPLVEMVATLPNAAAVLRHLGRNLDDTLSLAEMRPAQMAMQLASLSATLAKPKPVSAAPDPVRPTAGMVSRPIKHWSEAKTDEEFVRLRKEQIAARRR